MQFFEADERLSNFLHIIAAIPFGLAFVVMTITQFLVHAA